MVALCDSLHSDMQAYKVGPAIGAGQFGKVHVALHRRTLKRVAVKLIPADLSEIPALQAEISTHRALFHPNIVCLTDCFESKGEVCVVTEYCAGGDLLAKLQEEGRFDVEKVREVARGLCRGLRYLHEKGIVHRDLKLQNILLDDKGVVKICDFGFSSFLQQNAALTSVKGTPIYMAPELIREQPYTHAIDLWALGVILYELFVGIPPFYTTNIFKLVNLILEESIKWPPDIPPDLRNFLEGLLRKDPRDRLNWPELADHPFLEEQKPTAARELARHLDSAIDLPEKPSHRDGEAGGLNGGSISRSGNAGDGVLSRPPSADSGAGHVSLSHPRNRLLTAAGQIDWSALHDLAGTATFIDVLFDPRIINGIARGMIMFHAGNCQDSKSQSALLAVLNIVEQLFLGIKSAVNTMPARLDPSQIQHLQSFMRTALVWLASLLKGFSTAINETTASVLNQVLIAYDAALHTMFSLLDRDIPSVSSRPVTPVSRQSQPRPGTPSSMHMSWALLSVVTQTFLPLLSRLLRGSMSVQLLSLQATTSVFRLIRRSPQEIRLNHYDDILNLELILHIVRCLDECDNRVIRDVLIAVDVLIGYQIWEHVSADLSAAMTSRELDVLKGFLSAIESGLKSRKRLDSICQLLGGPDFGLAAKVLLACLHYSRDLIAEVANISDVEKSCMDRLEGKHSEPADQHLALLLVAELLAVDPHLAGKMALMIQSILDGIAEEQHDAIWLSCLMRCLCSMGTQLLPAYGQALQSMYSQLLDATRTTSDLSKMGNMPVPLLEAPCMLLECMTERMMDSLTSSTFWAQALTYLPDMLELNRRSQAEGYGPLMTLSAVRSLARFAYRVAALNGVPINDIATAANRMMEFADPACLHQSCLRTRFHAFGDSDMEKKHDIVQHVVGLQYILISHLRATQSAEAAMTGNMMNILKLLSFDLSDDTILLPLALLDNYILCFPQSATHELLTAPTELVRVFWERVMTVGGNRNSLVHGNSETTQQRLRSAMILFSHFMRGAHGKKSSIMESYLLDMNMLQYVPAVLIYPSSVIRAKACSLVAQLARLSHRLVRQMTKVGILKLITAMCRAEEDEGVRTNVWKAMIVLVKRINAEESRDVVEMAVEAILSKDNDDKKGYALHVLADALTGVDGYENRETARKLLDPGGLHVLHELANCMKTPAEPDERVKQAYRSRAISRCLSILRVAPDGKFTSNP
ncbi:ULK/FUSED protein kinase [Spizellomyces punctatus DAOM BR117]|uniref:non-specific serine/threonine protein kinase n=1 Tax=Spizellomyces punctatus (strain DAOM BR117) TaxID=645134 RepID=A0A0L0HSB1_SPIPD|nr:ULK/FUSED protein kinase [Spizellomyces punctatus DAOM BR117]KND04013.1 ULK/FUSED protein kinase [Spizellomyces punctatus DAOM BR117]|eukprot:XP_016612052.1 ULK/FUSED protein kinase [Spizellomyces punctatus DAOM BR117]